MLGFGNGSLPAVSFAAQSVSTEVRFSSPKEASHVLKYLAGRIGMVALKGGQVIAAQKTQLVEVNIGLRQRCSPCFVVRRK